MIEVVEGVGPKIVAQTDVIEEGRESFCVHVEQMCEVGVVKHSNDVPKLIVKLRDEEHVEVPIA